MKVLCFGDSNTYGFDPRSFLGDRYAPNHRWTNLFAELTGWDVINAGINGLSIPKNGSAAQLLRQYAPVDVLIVMLGTNDLLQGDSVENIILKMESFLSPAVSQCRQIVLIAPYLKRGDWVPDKQLICKADSLAEKYQSLTKKLPMLFADTRRLNLTLCFDGVHFTEEDHHRFAHLLNDILQNKKKLS